MRLEAPFWWYRERGALASALAPLGRLFGRLAERRAARVTPYRSRLPVICIGNLTAGGGGKTPTALAVAALLGEFGARAYFLTRGYGGTSEGPLLVRKEHSASEVGDEPLLLAEAAPTIVSADRVAGAKAIEATEASVIVMDDGFQNPSLVKDLSLIVVDAGVGLGNELIMPAGPLRAPLDAQLGRADALVVIGFAGIANPQKFFATLGTNGAGLEEKRAFPDHYRYTNREAAALLKLAKDRKAMLVTTEKDWVRLPDEEGTPLGELKFRSRPFAIAVQFDDAAGVKELLAATIAKATA